MKPLTKSQIQKLDLSQTLLAFDFDGTLSPIVSKPSLAGTSKSFLPMLKELSDRGALIAVITGRAIKDLKPLLRFHPDFIAGNHGMEGLEAFSPTAERARKICRLWVKDLKKSWPKMPHVFLEDKKESLSLHYRGAPDTRKARRALEELIAGLQPRPRVVGGKFLINLIPAGSPHKGLALKEVMRLSQKPKAVFVGDDDTDEDGFRQKLPALTIRVGKKTGSAARFYIRNQKELGRVLRWLTDTAVKPSKY